MVKTLAVILLPFLLGACATLSSWPPFAAQTASGLANEPGQYSFLWRLSGDRAVAPLQVFDNGRQTWLQFAPQQAVPAIFERSTHGDRPLTYRREGAYIVLAGVWPRLVLRGGHLSSHVERIPQASLPPAHEQGGGVSLHSWPSTPTHSTGLEQTANTSLSIDEPPGDSLVLHAAPIMHAPALPPAVADVAATTMAVNGVGPADRNASYDVSPQDHTLRSALVRWAQYAGWTFEPEHWAVDADIPIVGAASFESEFEPAVQELVAATELADRPLQPCFYSNRVLRIVPYAQSCDRTVGAMVSS
jgi:hypothetical protein